MTIGAAGVNATKGRDQKTDVEWTAPASDKTQAPIPRPV
jgi:hypothetical protein